MELVGSTIRLANGLALSYFEQGHSSGPVLIMVPGPTDSWLSYSPVLEHLPPSIRAIAVSMRGHGDSDQPETGYRVADFAADLTLFLDALDVEQAVLAGHSGSCLVVRRLAIDASDRVTGLVLEACPLTLHGDQPLETFLAETLGGLRDPIHRAFIHRFVVDTSTGELDPGLLESLVDEVGKVPARVWQETFAGLLDYDDISKLARVDVPTLLIWGDTDGLVSRPAQDQLLAILPQAELTVYEGAGHTPRWEQPARFAADVLAFVRQVQGLSVP
jgi:pimeloyl-ACP methyl ester carboxylesterase